MREGSVYVYLYIYIYICTRTECAYIFIYSVHTIQGMYIYIYIYIYIICISMYVNTCNSQLSTQSSRFLQGVEHSHQLLVLSAEPGSGIWLGTL